MIKVLGIEKSVGEFTPANSTHSFQYNNYNIYGLETDNTDMIAGHKATKIKIKIDEFNKVLPGVDPASLLDQIIEIYYNQYGRISKIIKIK